MTRINNDERTQRFGKPCTPANHRLYVTPWGIRVQVHKLIAARFAAACVAAHRESRWRPQRIDGYNCRTIRGSDSYSTHAWALSHDFFATPPGVPPPGGVWTPDHPPDAAFVAAFVTRGFTWGGTFKRKDTPHLEWAAVPPGTDPPPSPSPPVPWKWSDYMPAPLDRTSAVACPTGGYWEQSAEGGIYAEGGAPHLGAYNATPQLHNVPRLFVALVATPEGGYVQVATTGEAYAWNPK